jgi:NAD-dependent DNA ligase
VVFPERVSDTRDGTFASKKLKKVSIPKNVEKIGTSAFHYMCENLTLELYDTLAPFAGTVAYDMGWTGLSCAKHRIAIKDSSTDNIKYVVYMGQSNGTASQYRKAVVNGWKSDGTFDFPALDAAYSFLREASEKVEVAILRLKYPIDLSAEMKKKYEDYLKRSAKKLLSQCVQSHDMETAVFLGELGILNGDAIGAAVDICDTKDDPAMMAWLLEQQSQMPRKAKNAGGALSLSTKGKAEWQSHKDHPELVKRYQGTDTEICFPTEVKGIKITGIANSTAKLPDNYAAITAVTIPEGYTVIGENAFHGCENLETVVLPSTMKRLEKNCFKGCKALKHISIPASVEFIGDDAFSGTSIREFELLSDTEMGDYSLGSAVTLIARGKSTGCFINNHYIGYSLTYVYSDGVVKGTGIPASTIMPLSYVDIATEEAFQKTEPKILEGKTVYCLGTLKALTKGQTYFPRIQFPEFVENLGGTYAARFGKSTDILVTYEIDPENGTIQKAEQQGTMVLTELEFLKMVQEKAELEK